MRSAGARNQNPNQEQLRLWQRVGAGWHRPSLPQKRHPAATTFKSVHLCAGRSVGSNGRCVPPPSPPPPRFASSMICSCSSVLNYIHRRHHNVVKSDAAARSLAPHFSISSILLNIPEYWPPASIRSLNPASNNKTAGANMPWNSAGKGAFQISVSNRAERQRRRVTEVGRPGWLAVSLF